MSLASERPVIIWSLHNLL